MITVEFNVLIAYLLSCITKLGLSLGLGCLIGWERETQDKPAGLRDVALITVGSTLFTMIALELQHISATLGAGYDMGRIIAYVIVSMGFLGSGVIVQNKHELEGITTAAILWTMVAVGILCGLAIYPLAILAGIFIYFIVKLKHIKIKFEERRHEKE